MAQQLAKRWSLSLLAALACLVTAHAPLAQPAPGAQTASAPQSAARAASSPVQSQFQVFKVIVDPSGVETLEEARDASPGDVLEYRATYRNVSQRRLLQVDIGIPIPWGMSLLADSVYPREGKLIPSQRLESRADRDRPRVLWRVAQFDPGQTLQFKLRVSIDPDPTLAQPQPPNPWARPQPRLRK